MVDSVKTKNILECLISFNGNGEMSLNSSITIEEKEAELIAAIIKPFFQLADPKKLTEEGHTLKIKLEFIDSQLDNYSIGFTRNTRLKHTEEIAISC